MAPLALPPLSAAIRPGSPEFGHVAAPPPAKVKYGCRYGCATTWAKTEKVRTHMKEVHHLFPAGQHASICRCGRWFESGARMLAHQKGRLGEENDCFFKTDKVAAMQVANQHLLDVAPPVTLWEIANTWHYSQDVRAAKAADADAERVNLIAEQAEAHLAAPADQQQPLPGFTADGEVDLSFLDDYDFTNDVEAAAAAIPELTNAPSQHERSSAKRSYTAAAAAPSSQATAASEAGPAPKRARVSQFDYARVVMPTAGPAAYEQLQQQAEMLQQPIADWAFDGDALAGPAPFGQVMQRSDSVLNAVADVPEVYGQQQQVQQDAFGMRNDFPQQAFVPDFPAVEPFAPELPVLQAYPQQELVPEFSVVQPFVPKLPALQAYPTPCPQLHPAHMACVK